MSERELQAQQDLLRLQFGQLCAINAIARGNSNKVQEIATLKAKGKTWTRLANSNGVSIATVVQTTRNAHHFDGDHIFKRLERATEASEKLKNMGIKAQVAPGS